MIEADGERWPLNCPRSRSLRSGKRGLRAGRRGRWVSTNRSRCADADRPGACRTFRHRQLWRRQGQAGARQDPAGWAESLLVMATDPVILAVNSAMADGTMSSWMWDMRYEKLRGRRVIAAGEEATDLALRLAIRGRA